MPHAHTYIKINTHMHRQSPDKLSGMHSNLQTDEQQINFILLHTPLPTRRHHAPFRHKDPENIARVLRSPPLPAQAAEHRHRAHPAGLARRGVLHKG